MDVPIVSRDGAVVGVLEVRRKPGGAAFEDGKGREPIAFLGDNIQDFPAMKQSLRDEPESAFEPFGKRFFVLPNPMYGSWQQTPPR